MKPFISVIPPIYLPDRILLMEQEELQRLLKTPFGLGSFPEKYTLGPSHSNWVRIHAGWSLSRYYEIIKELNWRGISFEGMSYRELRHFVKVNKNLYVEKDYKPTREDIFLNQKRLWKLSKTEATLYDDYSSWVREEGICRNCHKKFIKKVKQQIYCCEDCKKEFNKKS